MQAHDRSNRSVRIVAALLASVWLGAGIAAIAVAVIHGRILPGVLGVAALGYGLLWVRVACLGRRLDWREALWPWRGGRNPGP